MPIKVDQINVNLFLDTRKYCGYNVQSLNKQIDMQAMNVSDYEMNVRWNNLALSI